MYTMYIDEELLFDPAGVTDDHIILTPKLSMDVHGAGSLEFVMPPGHAKYNDIRKLKGIITVKQGDDIIFRGRALSDERDFYNQKNVYCEGDRSFFLDSQCAPYSYTGTVIGLLQQRIDDHNSQVEEDKRFTLGNVTAVTASETMTVENVAYWETWKEIDEKLLSVYGGYMKTRTEGGVTYLDWLAVSGEINSQTIEFSVNLLDLKDSMDAADVFTILIPLGSSDIGDGGEYTEPVNITSVNNGVKYIQDDEAIAKYGKIWRTKTWNHVTEPSVLLQKGLDYLNTGIELKTLHLKAIDMHFIDGNADDIRVGDYVHIVSRPHGLDLIIICTKIDIDPLNPENTVYTFGEAPRTLTDNVVSAKEEVSEVTGARGGGGGRSVKEELKDYIRWAEIRTDANEATIDLLTGEVSRQGERLSTAEISLDGVNAQIVLKADVSTVTEIENRVTAAEIEVDGLNAQIVLKASATTVNELGERVSSAEIVIDGLNSEIHLKADKTYVQTLIASEIEAAFGDFGVAVGERVTTGHLIATTGFIGSLSITEGAVTPKTLNIVTSFTPALGEDAPTAEYTLLVVA